MITLIQEGSVCDLESSEPGCQEDDMTQSYVHSMVTRKQLNMFKSFAKRPSHRSFGDDSNSSDTGSDEDNNCHKNDNSLPVLLTMPVYTATAERSFNCLRRLKTYLRSTTKETRLSSLSVVDKVTYCAFYD